MSRQPTNFERQRWEKQRNALQMEWETRTNKLAKLRQSFAIETSAASQFQLETLIQVEESEITRLETQLSELEQALMGGTVSAPTQTVSEVASTPIAVSAVETRIAMQDFFVSYNRADKQWAEWIAWTLEEAGYSVVIQAWDFRPGGNFVLDMQRAAAESQKTIAVLSESYLKASYTQPEWAAAFADDPESLKRKLIPVRVKDCQPTGMLSPIVYIDLVGLAEDEAQQAVLDGLKPTGRPDRKPAFPGQNVSERVVPTPVVFPEAESTQRSNELSAVDRIVLESRRQDLAAKVKQRNAVANTLRETVDPDICEKLSLKLERLEAEMRKLAQEIDTLSGGDRAE